MLIAGLSFSVEGHYIMCICLEENKYVLGMLQISHF